jgi:hypothetical protein
MADLTPLLREVRGVYSDLARDRLPAGSVWAMTDWIPEILQAGARMRGAWFYQNTDPFAVVVDGMLYAPYAAGSVLLAVGSNSVNRIPEGAVGTSTFLNNLSPTRQNPVFHRNRVIVPAANGTSAPKYITYNGTTFTFTDGPASALTGRYATVWKDRLVLANSAAQPSEIAFSKPGDPVTAWDSTSLVYTSYDITGLAAQRTQILVFHASSVERVRGTTPPDITLSDATGDLLLDTLWDRAGCYDARSIAYWQDNVIFCDARGIWLTDGAVVRNMTVQGGIINLWHQNFRRGGADPLTIAGGVHQDYYICTIRNLGFLPTTFVVHIPTRRAFMLSNLDVTAYAFSVGTGEKLFGADAGAFRVSDLSPIFNPDPTILQVDGDGAPVLPSIETGWYRLSKGPGLKRMRDLHVSYVAVRDDDQEVLQAYYAKTPTGPDHLLGELRPLADFDRRKLPVNRPLEGIAIRLTQLLPTKDSRLYDLSIRAYAEEATRMRTS